LVKRKQIIVGAGTAAVSALKQLRKAGCDDDVLVFSMENQAPYSPMSLPYVVLGKMELSEIRMVPDDFFERMNAVFVRDRKVVGVEPAHRSISCEDGSKEGYDRLLIATGSDPIVPPVLGEVDAMGFHVMEDYFALAGRLTGAKRVAIVGAGMVAMEMAAALATKGHKVTVVAPRERILRNYFDLETSGRIIDLFAEAGVTVQLNYGVAVRAEQHSGEKTVHFAGGRTIEADVLLACLGVNPRTAFLVGSGIEVKDGIVVDGCMRTNVPHVFAAGDVAEAPDFFTGLNRMNPILPAAASQGKAAGNSMADGPSGYEGSLTMNAFNFFDHLAVCVGKVVAAEKEEVLTGTNNGWQRRLVFAGDVLVGASFLDVEVDVGVLQYLIRKRIPIGKYREMLLERPREVAFWLMNEAEKKETVSKEE
jgi:phenylglyoxylate dehydrogenase epsilon subunit